MKCVKANIMSQGTKREAAGIINFLICFTKTLKRKQARLWRPAIGVK